MSGEVWQFILIGGAGAVIAVLWLFIIYPPRRTAEDEGEVCGVATPTEDPEGRD